MPTVEGISIAAPYSRSRGRPPGNGHTAPAGAEDHWRGANAHSDPVFAAKESRAGADGHSMAVTSGFNAQPGNAEPQVCCHARHLLP